MKDYCAPPSNGQCSCRKFGADPDDCSRGIPALTDTERGHLAAAVECVIAAYEEELAIVRRERDLAESAARHEAGNANHWRTNHADQVARCALLRQRPDLPVDRIPAYEELTRLQMKLMTARAGLETAIFRIEGMLKGDDGQAWKEASKAMPSLRALL